MQVLVIPCSSRYPSVESLSMLSITCWSVHHLGHLYGTDCENREQNCVNYFTTINKNKRIQPIHSMESIIEAYRVKRGPVYTALSGRSCGVWRVLQWSSSLSPVWSWCDYIGKIRLTPKRIPHLHYSKLIYQTALEIASDSGKTQSVSNRP